MQKQLVILVGMAMIFVITFHKGRDKTKREWSQNLKGWQWVFGLVAFVAVLLIMLNPEFLALGLLGDTAFFDMLVLALSVQMHTFVIRAFKSCAALLARGFRYIGIPSPGLRYVIAVSTVAIASSLSDLQRALHRISS